MSKHQSGRLAGGRLACLVAALLLLGAGQAARGHVGFIHGSPHQLFVRAPNVPGTTATVSMTMYYRTEPESLGQVGRLSSTTPWVVFSPAVVSVNPWSWPAEVTATLTIPEGLGSWVHTIPFEVSDGYGPPETGLIRLELYEPVEVGYRVESDPVIVYVPPGTTGGFTAHFRLFVGGAEGRVRSIFPFDLGTTQPGTEWFWGVSRTTIAGNSWGFVPLVVNSSLLPDGSIRSITLPVQLEFGDQRGEIRFNLNLEVWKVRPPPALRAFPQVLEFEVDPNGPPPPAQTLSISLKGDTGVGYSALPRSVGLWLLTQNLEPVVPARVVVRVDPERLAGHPAGEIEISGGGFPRPLGKVPVVIAPPRGRAPVTIPHIADGGGFRTLILLTNPHATAESVRIEAFTGDGLSWPLGFPPVTIPAGGTVALETAGAGAEAVSGWARVVSARALAGTVVFRRTLATGVQESAVPLRRSAPARWLFPFDERVGTVTGLALANSDPESAASVRVLAMNEAGTPFHDAALPAVPALGHRAFVLSELIPELKHRRGVLELSVSGGAVAAVPLRFSAEGVMSSVEAQALFERPAGGAHVFLFPHIAAGGGFSSTISLSNLEAEPARVRLTARAAAGDGTTVAWPAGWSGTEVEIGSGKTLEITLPDEGAMPASGMVRVESDRRLGGMVEFRRAMEGLPAQAAAVALMAPGGPLVAPFDNRDGVVTAVALANAHLTEEARVTLTARNASGVVLETATVNLPAQGHRAVALTGLLPRSAGEWGGLEIRTEGGSASAIALRFLAAGAFTSIQMWK
jgi:hypothetical protein